MLAMKVGQFPVQAVLVEEKMDIVTAKDFLSAGKFTRCRRCDAAQALVSHLGNISMIKIERKVTTKLGWNP
jgi:predicted ATP-dependent Lon-type protease